MHTAQVPCASSIVILESFSAEWDCDFVQIKFVHIRDLTMRQDLTEVIEAIRRESVIIHREAVSPAPTSDIKMSFQCTRASFSASLLQ